MTVALAVAALGLAAWPRPDDRHRIRALRALDRLAPVPVSVRPRARSVRLARPPSSLLLGGGAAAAGFVLAPSQGGVAAGEFALALLAVGAALLLVGRRAVAARRRDARDAQMSLALAIVVGELAAGAPASAALRAAGAVGAEIERRIEASGAEDGAIGDPVARVVAAWRVSAVHGVPLAELLSRVRADLADTIAGRREVQTAVAGPQASAAVLALLPLLGVALGAAMGANPLAVLFTTPVGRVLLCLGAVLDALGIAWTARLMTSVQS